MRHPLVTVFVDRAVDEINAFHRDERKAQVRQIRAEAALRGEEALKVANLADPNFIADKAREFAREFLADQYSEAVVERRTLAS